MANLYGRIALLAPWLALAMLLAGCGQKGGLVRPEAAAEQPLQASADTVPAAVILAESRPGEANSYSVRIS